MEKENTAKSGTGGTGTEQDKSFSFEKMMGCCAAMSGPGGKGEKMKDMCGGMMSDPKMMAKMKDCCGGKGLTPEMMEKWKNCCGSGEKKE